LQVTAILQNCTAVRTAVGKAQQPESCLHGGLGIIISPGRLLINRGGPAAAQAPHAARRQADAARHGLPQTPHAARRHVCHGLPGATSATDACQCQTWRLAPGRPCHVRRGAWHLDVRVTSVRSRSHEDSCSSHSQLRAYRRDAGLGVGPAGWQVGRGAVMEQKARSNSTILWTVQSNEATSAAVAAAHNGHLMLLLKCAAPPCI
jgi:hypothetical protein